MEEKQINPRCAGKMAEPKPTAHQCASSQNLIGWYAKLYITDHQATYPYYAYSHAYEQPKPVVLE